MGEMFLRSVLAQEEAITASTIVTYDLPVLPLSHILLTFRWQDGAVLGNAGNPIADLLSFIDRIEVLLRGSSIYSLNGEDSFYMGQLITKMAPHMINVVNGATERHYLTWLIPFGRKPYNRGECFPATARGQLQLQITYAAAVGTVDTPAVIIETVELPEATPARFLKTTTLSVTPSAAGDFDLELPIGNPIVGVGLFATTVPTGASTNRSIGELRLLVDNKEMMYAKSNWESFHSEAMMRAPMMLNIDRHTHAQDANTDTVTGQQLLGIIGRNQYAYLDFDPLMDDTYMLETAGKSRVNLRINAEGVNDAIRAMPIEWMQV
ncbi:MAG: hypothetical protein WBC70_17320 [Candidatus Aminicenantales bacterium]